MGENRETPSPWVLYGLRLSVLVEQIWWEYPGFLQLWYSDDFSTAGVDAHLKPAIACIEALGPACRLFIGQEK